MLPNVLYIMKFPVERIISELEDKILSDNDGRSELLKQLRFLKRKWLQIGIIEMLAMVVELFSVMASTA